MPRPRGLPKSSGRQPGSKNKRKRLLPELIEVLNIDVPTQLMNLLPTLEPNKRADVLLEMMQYIYAKKRAIEHITSEAVSVSIEATQKQFLTILSDPESLKAAELLAERFTPHASR